MNSKLYVSFLVCLMVAVSVASTSDTLEGNNAEHAYNSSLLALEQEYNSTHHASYFRKALTLLRVASSSSAKMNDDFHTFKLDLASGVLLKTRDGHEFGSDDSAIRHCQAGIIAQLATVDLGRMNDLATWQALRARYARLLMFQRATWISLRDPTLDGALIALDSTIGPRPDPAVEQVRLDRNRRVALQFDLNRFMTEVEPLIDRFMIDAFSLDPEDFRMLNELLAIGLYTPADRARVVISVEKNTQPLPYIVRAQLPAETTNISGD